MKPSERFRRAGFTLVEVMAAVAVLGLLYVVVARSAMQGLQVEGDASRRMRASLLADRVLSGLELDPTGGSAPPLGDTETSEEEFTVLVEVRPFDVAGLLEEAMAESANREGSASSLQLLNASASGGAPTLLSIEVRVTWIEGISEQEVTRTSFAFDAEAAAPLLDQIQARDQEREAAEEAER